MVACATTQSYERIAIYEGSGTIPTRGVGASGDCLVQRPSLSYPISRGAGDATTNYVPLQGGERFAKLVAKLEILEHNESLSPPVLRHLIIGRSGLHESFWRASIKSQRLRIKSLRLPMVASRFASLMAISIPILNVRMKGVCLASQLIGAIDRLSGKLTRACLTLIMRARGSRNLSGEIPTRLHRNGRPIDNNFLPFHCVYFRFTTEDILGTHLIPGRIPYFDVSVNWSKYSCPLDVIIRYSACGIARLFVFCLPVIVPIELRNKKRDIYHHKFCFEHDPEDDNYSHSQITSFKGSERILRSSSISATAKKEIRQLISDRSFIILYPKV
jgi:hypothetical protein